MEVDFYMSTKDQKKTISIKLLVWTWDWCILYILYFHGVVSFHYSKLVSFMEFENVKFDQASHAYSEGGKCKDTHIPTCKLDNKANPFYIMLRPPPPELHAEVLGHQDACRY